MEMLPWDVWGQWCAPTSLWLVLFHRLASLTHVPDATLTELRGLYEGDERLRVPVEVFNAMLNRPETISASF
jgi:hypothetical protein